MSGKNTLNDSFKKIAVHDIVLEYILSHHWDDCNNYSSLLVDTILKQDSIDNKYILKRLLKIPHQFFHFNNIKKEVFFKSFPLDKIITVISEYNKLNVLSTDSNIIFPPIIIEQIFPEIKKVNYQVAELLLDKLDISERLIQDELRVALRDIGATNMVQRKSDSSLEVADLEDFNLKVENIFHSFTAVVKGYRSISGKTVTLEDIMHQIVKAYDTRPNYILLFLAKNPTDGLITRLVKYGSDVGNRNLVVIIDPINLVKFLKIRKII
jgi:hypothetical protein